MVNVNRGLGCLGPRFDGQSEFYEMLWILVAALAVDSLIFLIQYIQYLQMYDGI